MTITPVAQPTSVSVFPQTGSVGDDAEKLIKLLIECYVNLLNNISIGKPKKDALSSLDDVFEETCKPDWDGYSASAVSFESYVGAKKFIYLFPTSLPTPEVAADPDGEISLEWYVAPNRIFSVSVGPNGELNYAGIFGPNKTHGVEVFFDEIPKVVLENVRRVYGLI